MSARFHALAGAAPWRLLGGTVAVVFLVAFSTSSHAQSQPFAFGLWGDMPYGKAKDEAKIPALIADMNASDIAFSLYDGDNATNLLTNLTRVQTFGSPNIHWIRVTVDSSSREVFTFHPMIVEANK
jgi:hypothetical protein